LISARKLKIPDMIVIWQATHPSPRSVLELEGRDYYETGGVIFSRTALDNNQPVT